MLGKGLVLFAESFRPTNGALSRAPIPALEHVANRPIAHHVLDAVLASGVEEIIVAGTAEVLTEARPCLAQYKPRLSQLEYVICGDGADPLAALCAAAPLVGEAPCLVHPAEGLLAQPMTPFIESLATEPFDVLLLRSEQGLVHLLENSSGGRGRAQPVRRPSEVGLFGAGVLRQVCDMGTRPDMSTMDAIAGYLSDNGQCVEVRSVEGWCRYAGRPDELLELNRLALDLLEPAGRQLNRHGNQIEGRVHIDPTASVRSSVIVGPAVIGEGAAVTNAYIGPYTAIGDGARIEGAEVERSIVSPGAVVTHVGTRLVSSIIGRRAHVTRDFALPRAVRLRVGEGDEVALC